MKTLIFSILLFTTLPSFSQIVVSGVDINSIDSIKVCTVKIENIDQIFGDKDISVDYGQVERKATKRFTEKLTGKRLNFNSVTHVINYMENNGWLHYDSQILATKTETIHYFHFRKK